MTGRFFSVWVLFSGEAVGVQQEADDHAARGIHIDFAGFIENRVGVGVAGGFAQTFQFGALFVGQFAGFTGQTVIQHSGGAVFGQLQVVVIGAGGAGVAFEADTGDVVAVGLAQQNISIDSADA